MPTKTKAVKKATKKTVSKTAKKATKKTTAKSKKAKALVCASGEKCFWTTDGKILHDLNELKDALSYMTENVFAYHVTKEKNDFADWVGDVLRDKDCAKAMLKARKPSSAKTIVVRHLKFYQV